MSVSKHLESICCVALAVALLLTVVMMNGETLGIQASDTSYGYETRLFDTSKVHSIDIVMDDWDSFIDSCESEDYEACSLVIDGEAFTTVAIRAKGNTSLSSVANYGNDRYSFKVEFDHYDSGTTYYGLDKLCLTNLIQDNTYMKDYLSYRLMASMGVSSPLCSYVWITVNGEDWGLYLAVEGIEESFLTRNYGSDYGELYKPDSMSMGGGRGNGMDFSMDDFLNQDTADSSDPSGSSDSSDPSGDTTGSLPSGGMGGMNGGMGDGRGGGFPGNSTGDSASSGSDSSDAGTGTASDSASIGSDSSDAGSDAGTGASSLPSDFDFSDFGGMGDIGGGMGGGGGGGMSDAMGSDDVLLQYIDDDASSYSNIFSSAKTNVTEEDEERLIASLKTLSEGDATTVVDTDAVISYFVVHGFLCNGDSYTGSMIHNYYLYEKDGVLSMIPWDYNLAFGGFDASSDATSVVNSPIDTPVSSGSISERPMLAWIFADEDVLASYHETYQTFLDTWYTSGALQELIEETYELIAPYVEQDPTSFCTYDEFTAGVTALKTFCELRCESVQGQLNGEIPSTSDGQSADSSSLIDASSLSLSDMGSMNAGGGAGGGPDGDDMPGGKDFDFSGQPGGFSGGGTMGGDTATDGGTATDGDTSTGDTTTGDTTTGGETNGDTATGDTTTGDAGTGTMPSGGQPGGMQGGTQPGGSMPGGNAGASSGGDAGSDSDAGDGAQTGTTTQTSAGAQTAVLTLLTSDTQTSGDASDGDTSETGDTSGTDGTGWENSTNDPGMAISGDGLDNFPSGSFSGSGDSSMDFQQPSSGGASSSASGASGDAMQTVVLLLVSLAVLAFGLVFAFLFKR